MIIAIFAAIAVFITTLGLLVYDATSEWNRLHNDVIDTYNELLDQREDRLWDSYRSTRMQRIQQRLRKLNERK